MGGVDAWAVIHAAAYTLMPLWGYYQHGDGIGVPGVIQARHGAQVSSQPC